MSKKQRYFRIDTGKFEGVYELEMLTLPGISDAPIKCPCCNRLLKPLIDIIQWGFWEDAYATYFFCKPCQKVWEYDYVVLPELVAVDTSRCREELKDGKHG